MTKKKDVGCMKQGIDYEICKECRATYTLDKIGREEHEEGLKCDYSCNGKPSCILRPDYRCPVHN
jgi:hypothetical protein